MNNKDPRLTPRSLPELDLTTAVEQFIQQGGVIHVVPNGATAEVSVEPMNSAPPEAEGEDEQQKKLEQLKSLVAKGAGVNALQYSLRMNKREVRRMACENGLKISYSRPIRGVRQDKTQDSDAVDDELAGHAMHYSSLGYTALEIAQKLGMSVRQVWKIGQDYRFEFKQNRDRIADDQHRED
ncbi:MAG: hypothetical protein JWQ69_4749 [Pseudomonas sp.]|nr:hypothetical protein [Pseudomonas sp.]